MAELKNIIFDLGGVLLNIDYALTEKAFVELGYVHFEKMYSQFVADELFSKLETGKVSEAEFYKVMTDAGPNEITKEKIHMAWNAMLLRWRVESLNFLEALSKRYRLFLLSNTNAIHLRAFNEILKQQTGLNDGIDHYFEKAYYSHLIGYRKPGKEAFEFIAKDARIKPEETLFIDDSYNNLLAPGEMGFKTYLLKGREQIEELDYDQF